MLPMLDELKIDIMDPNCSLTLNITHQINPMYLADFQSIEFNLKTKSLTSWLILTAPQNTRNAGGLFHWYWVCNG